MAPPERLAFGDFVLESSQQRVRHRDGTPLNLTPRLYSALDFFVHHAGELLDKETLLRELWPGLVVEENNLNQVVSALRRSLGDDAQGSRFIQTVPRRGFRFVASVTTVTDIAAPELQSIPALEAKPAAGQAGGTETPAGASHVSRRRLLRSGPAAAAVVSLGGAAWWAWLRRSGASRGAPPATLAVLPFKPLPTLTSRCRDHSRCISSRSRARGTAAASVAG